MLCVDEKSQIQALDRTAPILPLQRPPSPAALAEADRIRGGAPQPGQHVVLDRADYVAAAAAPRPDSHGAEGEGR